MNFTYEELASLNEMISIALMSGKVECDNTTKEVHKKIADEIMKRNATEKEVR